MARLAIIVTSFTLLLAACSTPPTHLGIVSVTPDTAENVPLDTVPSVTFDRAVDEGTLAAANLEVLADGAAVTLDDVTLGDGDRTVSLLIGELLPATEYTIAVAAGVAGTDGRTLGEAYAFTFTTAATGDIGSEGDLGGDDGTGGSGSDPDGDGGTGGTDDGTGDDGTGDDGTGDDGGTGDDDGSGSGDGETGGNDDGTDPGDGTGGTDEDVVTPDEMLHGDPVVGADGKSVVVTFTKMMDWSTFNSTSFKLNQGFHGEPVLVNDGLDEDGHFTVRLVFDEPLPAGDYELIITTFVRDEDGKHLAETERFPLSITDAADL